MFENYFFEHTSFGDYTRVFNLAENDYVMTNVAISFIKFFLERFLIFYSITVFVCNSVFLLIGPTFEWRNALMTFTHARKT